MDNDGDGLTDFPLDIGCRAASGRDEVDACGQGVRFDDFPFNRLMLMEQQHREGTNAMPTTCMANMDGGQDLRQRVLSHNLCVRHGLPQDVGLSCVNGTCQTGNQFTGSCGGQNLTEKVYIYTNVVNANPTFKVTPRQPDGAGEPEQTLCRFLHLFSTPAQSVMMGDLSWHAVKISWALGATMGMIDQIRVSSATRRP